MSYQVTLRIIDHDSLRKKSHLLNILRHNVQLDFGSWPGRKKPSLWMLGQESDPWRISDICRTFEYQMGKTSMINSILRVSRASQRMSICEEVLIISLHVRLHCKCIEILLYKRIWNLKIQLILEQALQMPFRQF